MPIETPQQPAGAAQPRTRNAAVYSYVDTFVWFFIAVGVALRLYRFFLDFPVWGDEAFLAINIHERDYRGLTAPLGFGQICPVLFLWVERFIAVHWGFREGVLRLFPLLCSIASLFIFERLARLATAGAGLACSVAIFAVSFHPIRHAAEIKPYATDLCVSALILWLGVSWLGDRRRLRPLVAAIALAPLALGLSHPAVFTLAGMALALAPPAWSTGDRRIRLAHLGLIGVIALTFGWLFLRLLGPHNQAHLAGLRAYWAEAFPPLSGLWALLRWLTLTHTGPLFAYPGGGKDGASSATLILFILGAVVLRKRGRGDVVAVCLAPFALALAAAFLKRYPYGGEARQMQFLVPNICLLAGIGAGSIFERLPMSWSISFAGKRLSTMPLPAATVLGVAALTAMGAIPLYLDGTHPYRRLCDQQARRFATEFWPALAKRGRPAMVEHDFGLRNRRGHKLKLALYICNGLLHSDQFPIARGVDLDAITNDRPLICVVHEETGFESPLTQAWLETMLARFELKRTEIVELPMSDIDEKPRMEHCRIIELVPRREVPEKVAAGNGMPTQKE